jgi:hypothetical protein
MSRTVSVGPRLGGRLSVRDALLSFGRRFVALRRRKSILNSVSGEVEVASEYPRSGGAAELARAQRGGNSSIGRVARRGS